MFPLALAFSQSSAAGDLPDRAAIEVLPLNADERGLSGPGGDRLRGELGGVQFVAVGEDHGLADAPRLTAALAAELARIKGAPVYHAVEVGPNATRHVAGLLREEGIAGLDRLIDDQPYALPFLSHREDAELALPYARAGRLWGIDQEFIGSTALLCELLLKRTRDPAVRRQLEQWRESDRAALTAGKFETVVMTGGDYGALSALRDHFRADREGLRLAEALIASARIYRFNSAERYFENNQVRSGLMVDYFLEHYRAVKGPAPRVVLKMGIHHMGRGTSPTSIFDIGSLLPGLAAANGQRSLHVAYVPLAGQVRTIAPSPNGFTAVKDYKDELIGKLLAGAGIAQDVVPATGLVLIPLEPIRQRMTGKVRRELPEIARFIVLGFDYLVTTRDAKAATHFESWSPPAE